MHSAWKWLDYSKFLCTTHRRTFLTRPVYHITTQSSNPFPLPVYPLFVFVFLLYSKVPPLRNYIRRNSGLILLNKIPVYKKLSRLIHVQFLLQWYIVIFYCIYLNMVPISLSSLEIRMKVSSQNYCNFKKLSVLTQNISFLFNCAYLKNVFLTNFTAVWSTKVFLIP